MVSVLHVSLLVLFILELVTTVYSEGDGRCTVYPSKVPDLKCNGVRIICSGKNITDVRREIPKPNKLCHLSLEATRTVKLLNTADLFSGFNNLRMLSISNLSLHSRHAYTFAKMKKLNTLDLSGSHFVVHFLSKQMRRDYPIRKQLQRNVAFPFPKRNVQVSCSAGIWHRPIISNQNVKYVVLTHYFFPPDIIQLRIDAANLTRLDLSFNSLTNFRGPISGMPNLKVLNLSYSSLMHVDHCLFHGLVQLESLDISNNFFGEEFDKLSNKSYVFRDLTNLETIDLSKNSIQYISPSLFKYNFKLKHVNFSSNRIHTPGLDRLDLFSTEIMTIDLSHNYIQTIMRSERLHIAYLVSSIANTTFGDNRILTINLSNNFMDCSCVNLEYLVWLGNTSAYVVFGPNDSCTLPNGTEQTLIDNSRIIAQYIERECIHSATVVWIVVGIAIASSFGTVLVLMFIYKYRYALFCIWYRTMKPRKRRSLCRDRYDSDVFLSCCLADVRVIREEVLPALEKERGLQVYIYHRDCLPGVYRLTAVNNAIRRSKATIFFVTNNYLNDFLSMHEIEMAKVESIQTNRKFIIVLLCASLADIPTNILRLLQNEPIIEYPVDKSAVTLGAFWDDIANRVQSIV